jgi:hypothetical protein
VVHTISEVNMSFLVIDEHRISVCNDICSALSVMRERGRGSRVEDENGVLLASMTPAVTWAPDDYAGTPMHFS